MAASCGLAVQVLLLLVVSLPRNSAAPTANGQYHSDVSVILQQLQAGEFRAPRLPSGASKLEIPVSSVPGWSEGCDAVPTAGFNLTDEERSLLPHLCWRADLVPDTPEAAPLLSDSDSHRGIPPGVDCKHVEW